MTARINLAELFADRRIFGAGDNRNVSLSDR
jgi:hypothetical protein